MQSLTAIHPALAELWDLAPTVLQNRLRRYVPVLKEASGTGFGQGRAIPANAGTAAVIMLDWIDSAPLADIGERVPMLWSLRYIAQEARPVCRVTGASLLGEALTRVIEWDEVMERLDRFELERETATATLVWRGRVRPSVFDPYRTSKARGKAVEKARRGRINTVELGRDGFEAIAKLIEAHQP